MNDNQNDLLQQAIAELKNSPRVDIKGKSYTQVSTRINIFRKYFPTANEDIENIVNKKKFWLYKTTNKINEKASKSLRKEFISGELFWYLGKRYRLDVSSDCET